MQDMVLAGVIPLALAAGTSALPPAAAAAGAVLPQFSWDTLPVAFHSANSTGSYTAGQIEQLARYQMVTVEKFQDLRHIVPAATLAQPYESPGGLYACLDRNATDAAASLEARWGACWGRGEPLVVTHVHTRLTQRLTPTAFAREHSQLRVLLVDVKTASEFVAPLPHFFDGFAHVARRPQRRQVR